MSKKNNYCTRRGMILKVGEIQWESFMVRAIYLGAECPLSDSRLLGSWPADIATWLSFHPSPKPTRWKISYSASGSCGPIRHSLTALRRISPFASHPWASPNVDLYTCRRIRSAVQSTSDIEGRFGQISRCCTTHSALPWKGTTASWGG